MASSSIPFDRLVRKEVSLGAIREKTPPTTQIGLSLIAPWLEKGSDEAIFDYVADSYQDGLAPARADDVEAELSQKDETVLGQGKVSIVDWALKDKYTASDVNKYREDLLIAEAISGLSKTDLPLNWNGRQIDDFNKRIVRDDNRRSRYLYNRIESMIMQSIEESQITYNDGRQKWTIPWGRPTNQTDQAPQSGTYDTDDFDPIGDFKWVSQFLYDTYGVRPKRVIASRKLLNTFWNSSRFVARTGLVVGGSPVSSPIDMNYLVQGWSQDAAVQIVEAATGIKFIEYDSVYRTRSVGSLTTTNVRFLSENKFYFLPDDDVENTGVLGEIDETDVGFAKTMTAPHPEGNWQPGFYEWEDESKDPWMRVRGSGVKALPVFPYMELTYTMTALPA